jgi:Anthrone oxygenase
MPTNNTLKALSPDEAGPESRALLERWGRLHLRRTLLGVVSTALYVWAAVGSL